MATSKALNNRGIYHETTYIDYDKKVVEVKNALWGTNDIPIDITKYHTNEKFNLLTAGFPCQPFSISGKGLGFDDPRGKIYKEVLRIIKSTNPDYIILENVKAITFKKHKWIITEIENELKAMGYFVNTQIINAKNYLPQNRERVFIMASIYPINKVKDRTHDMVLGDFLESNVDESLYYSKEKLERISNWKSQEKCLDKISDKNTKYIKTITTRTQPGTSSQALIMDNLNMGQNIIKLIAEEFNTFDLLEMKDNEYWFKLSDGTSRKIGYREEQKNWLLPISRNYTNNIINDVRGILSTLTTSPKKIIVKNTKKYIYINKDGVDRQGSRIFKSSSKEINTLTTGGVYKVIENNIDDIMKNLTLLKIRSITPREAWRLMGWKDEDIDKVIHLPKSKLYFTAGNSMVIPVMEDVLRAVLGII